jgi:hypothetical protein
MNWDALPAGPLGDLKDKFQGVTLRQARTSLLMQALEHDKLKLRRAYASGTSIR